ncbi:hypothetical protein VTH06DRAFT_2563 [Thermothelomyces fergusii]
MIDDVVKLADPLDLVFLYPITSPSLGHIFIFINLYDHLVALPKRAPLSSPSMIDETALTGSSLARPIKPAKAVGAAAFSGSR